MRQESFEEWSMNFGLSTTMSRVYNPSALRDYHSSDNHIAWRWSAGDIYVSADQCSRDLPGCSLLAEADVVYSERDSYTFMSHHALKRALERASHFRHIPLLCHSNVADEQWAREHVPPLRKVGFVDALSGFDSPPIVSCPLRFWHVRMQDRHYFRPLWDKPVWKVAAIACFVVGPTLVGLAFIRGARKMRFGVDESGEAVDQIAGEVVGQPVGHA